MTPLFCGTDDQQATRLAFESLVAALTCFLKKLKEFVKFVCFMQRLIVIAFYLINQV